MIQKWSHNLSLLTIFLFISWISVALCSNQLMFPVAFTVIRSVSIGGNLTTFMNNIGYPSIDQNGNNIGYNLIALDGYKTSSSLSKMYNDVSPLGTWANLYQRIIGNRPNIYGTNNQQIQQYILNSFHNQASKIIMNAFSYQRPISEKNSSSAGQAQAITNYINSYNLDGVSIDFDDFNSVIAGTATAWLTDLLKTLRTNLGPSKLIVLQIPPTFITFAPIFSDVHLNSYIDLFVIKYYNLLGQKYVDFQSIFTRAGNYTGTAIWQIQGNTNIKIDVCKTVVAKPTSSQQTWDSTSFVDSLTIDNIFSQALNTYNWFGGYANLNFGSDLNGTFQNAALSALRTYCNRYEVCFCQ